MNGMQVPPSSSSHTFAVMSTPLMYLRYKHESQTQLEAKKQAGRRQGSQPHPLQDESVEDLPGPRDGSALRRTRLPNLPRQGLPRRRPRHHQIRHLHDQYRRRRGRIKCQPKKTAANNNELLTILYIQNILKLNIVSKPSPSEATAAVSSPPSPESPSSPQAPPPSLPHSTPKPFPQHHNSIPQPPNHPTLQLRGT